MKLNKIKSAEYWQGEYRRTYTSDYLSVKFIRRIQADAIRVAGNTAAQMTDAGHGPVAVVTTILKAAKELES